MQLKALIRNLAKEKGISSQLVMQNYMMERLLERISCSRFKDNFILKGGFLIAAIVGLNTRATMDMDTTIKGCHVNEQTVRQMVKEILNIVLNDQIVFKFLRIDEIRKGNIYPGYRVSLFAQHLPLSVPLKLDITTGQQITPKEIEFEYKLLFEDRSIPIMVYNLETIFAEKLETIISRGDQNTRLRDYYDVYILQKLQLKNVKAQHLREALMATATQRGSLEIINVFPQVIQNVRQSAMMRQHWENYKKDFAYTEGINFDDTCNAVIDVLRYVL